MKNYRETSRDHRPRSSSGWNPSGAPEVLAVVIVRRHDRVESRRAERDGALGGASEERAGDALAAMVGVDREAVEVAAPPIPTDDQRADKCAVDLGE